MPIRSLATSLVQFGPRAVDSAARTPFGRLVRHFVAKMFRGGEESSSEFELGIGGILGLLATPGAFLSLMLFDKYSNLLRWFRNQRVFDPYLTSLPDKYVFIVFAMVITGVVTVLKWDRILPDRQDYLNLGPLPVRPRTVLLANVTAILLVAVIFAIDVNAASMFLFPMVVTAEQGSLAVFLKFVAAHAICVLLASAFTFFAVFSLMGILLATAPKRMFRPLSLSIRAGVIAALLALLVSSFAGPSLVRLLQAQPDSAVRWLPSLWYLGLYQTLQGRADLALASAGKMGV